MVSEKLKQENADAAVNNDVLVVQWLRLCASTAGIVGLMPGRGTKILHAKWYSQKKKNSCQGMLV